MSRRIVVRRTAVLAPIAAAALVLSAGPAAAIPFEGDPDPSSCVRVVAYEGAGPAGSPLNVSQGYIAVLVPRSGC
jgi:hypothetical protein